MKLTEEKLIQAIEEVNNSPENYSNCQKLATFLGLKHYLFPENTNIQVSERHGNDVIGEYGESEFLKLIAGQPIEKVILVMDELMDAIKTLNPRLYVNTIDRL